eukprot:gb/GEZN01004142.1/.p1 GENE.gb/GEZN01004142.1/~~gb/GEZN01004142.1/.p1  ORF type:complete len:666 (-),score=79.37 gb/GEZN01004142.1/:19-1737(-)
MLSQLNHPSIVRYHQAWIEHWDPGLNLSSSSDCSEFSKSSLDPSTSCSEAQSVLRDIKAPDGKAGLLPWGFQLDLELASEPFQEEDQSIQETGNSASTQPTGSSVKRSKRGMGRVQILGCNICHSEYEDWEVKYEEWSALNASMQPLNLCVACYRHALQEIGLDASRVSVQIRTEHRDLFLCIQMEYCESSLDEVMRKKETTYEDRLKLLKDIVEGLAAMHQEGLVHRDLKPGNIFVTTDSKAKIGDLGLTTSVIAAVAADKEKQSTSLAVSISNPSIEAAKLHDLGARKELRDKMMTSGVGTILYTAPEVSHGSYDEKCDIFSLGVILFEMFYPPFSTGMERIHCINRLKKGSNFFSSERDWIVAHHLQTQLITALLRPDPAQRPSAKSLLEVLNAEDPTKESLLWLSTKEIVKLPYVVDSKLLQLKGNDASAASSKSVPSQFSVISPLTKEQDVASRSSSDSLYSLQDRKYESMDRAALLCIIAEQEARIAELVAAHSTCNCKPALCIPQLVSESVSFVLPEQSLTGTIPVPQSQSATLKRRERRRKKTKKLSLAPRPAVTGTAGSAPPS